MVDERKENIHEKGFSMDSVGKITDYSKMKVGMKTIADAILDLGSLKNVDKCYADKNTILKAIATKDLKTLRKISNYFYRMNGIYERTCNYFAEMYRYDWYIVPEIYDENVKESKVISEFTKILNYLDNSYLKKICGEIALNVVKDGVYYGYITDSDSGLVLQDLPVEYCRSRFKVGNMPAVEFNMRFFDDNFSDINYRMRILKMFPAEFAKGYTLYKQKKLQPDFQGDVGCWYLLEPQNTIKFSITPDDSPIFANAIVELINLDMSQDLDRRKQMQNLLKIIVQKLPLDKNGDLIFDVDEARDIHNNAVMMLSRAIGTDVLTTFTDVESIDLSDRTASNAIDDLEKSERTVYNAFGISKNIFNAEGNLATTNSILNDEGAMRKLILQFQIFFDKITQSRSVNKKKFNFRLFMLETTQYNYKELSKMYKEQVQIGYSKMLPQIALGHSQSAIINTAYFENDILKLSEIMIPPLMSSTMSSQDILGNRSKSSNNSSQINTEDSKSGRPELDDSKKSEKTIQNKESMN